MVPFSSKIGKGYPSFAGQDQTPSIAFHALQDPALHTFPASPFTKQHNESSHGRSHCWCMNTGRSMGSTESKAILSTLPHAQQATPQWSQELQLCWHFKGAPFGTTNEERHLHLVFSRHQFLAGKNMLLMCQPLFSGCYSTWSRQWMGSNITPWYHIGHGLLSNFWRGMWDYVW